MNQCKCGSTDFFTEEKGSATGLYCSKCGKWQKWLNKNEIRAFEHSQKLQQAITKRVMTNSELIRSMSDEELSEFIQKVENNGYNDSSDMPYDKADSILEWLQSEAEP